MVYVDKFDCYIDTDLVVYRTKNKFFHTAGKLYQCNVRYNKQGYPVVSASCSGKRYPIAIHRIVAEAFIENPLNLPTVDHINRDRKDYRLSNLRWASYQTQNNNRLVAISSQEKYNWRGVGREPKSRVLEINRIRMKNYSDTHVRVYLPNGTRRFIPKEHTMIIPYNVPVGFKHVIKPQYMHLYNLHGVVPGAPENN